MIFGDADYKTAIPGKSIHPAPKLRQLMVTSTFFSICESWQLDIDIDVLTNELGGASVEAIKSYQVITNKKVNKEVFDKKYYGENPIPKILTDNWTNNLRNELLKYTYKPLAQ